MSKKSYTKADIDREYEALGHEWGWSLMAGPESSLATAKLLIVGLNPARAAGDKRSDYGGHWDCPEGNIYFDQNWGGENKFTPLQQQIFAWHDVLGLTKDDSIGMNFVPFRSRSWAELEKPKESVAFANDLWRWALDLTPAGLIITMGKDAAWYLAQLRGGKAIATLPTGWGKQTMTVYDTSDGRRIVAMPHPSRYQIFGRGEKSEIAEQSLMTAADSASN